jgi:GDP/UDP-N,N'-diacetylbacillosamine 2-epimerase (hydrolysing)
MKKRKVCVVTGSRADYGLLKWVMEDIRSSASLELQLVATGMHLSPEFGLTYREIEADCFSIDRKVEMLLSSDTCKGVAKSMGVGLIGFADVLHDLAPDLLVVLGDRFEILSATCAALVTRIPIVHVHGGEKTEGAVDDAIRHAITKMSHLHFVASEEYRARVIQLGEAPDRVICVGGLGVDAIHRIKLLDRTVLETALDFRFGERNLLVTLHPETLSAQEPEAQMAALIGALEYFPDIHVIFTFPNADMGGRAIARQIEDYVTRHPGCKAYQSLGQVNFLSCLQFVDGVVGNSSSGLLEVPSFGKVTVNIGDRQRGRLRATSVLDCAADTTAIASAIAQIYSPDFQTSLQTVQNPYGDGGAAQRIVAALETIELGALLRKSFVDVGLQ